MQPRARTLVGSKRMTTGFQHQAPSSVNPSLHKPAATPQTVGKKLKTGPEPAQKPSENRTFR